MAHDLHIGEQSGLARMHSRQQLIVLTALIAIYSALPVALAADFIFQLAFGRASSTSSTPVIDTNALIEFVHPLANGEGGVLEALHKLILPLAALFLGANFSILKKSRLAAWLFLVPLLGTVAGLLSASLVDAFASSEIQGKYPGLSTLFRDVASNLGIVMMLLIGQSLGKQ